MKRPGWVILIVILLGGWLLNVASGWVCDQVLSWGSPTFSITKTIGNRPPSAADADWWQRHAPTDWPRQPTTARRWSLYGTQLTRLFHYDSIGSSVLYSVRRQRSGWPFVSMEGARWRDGQSSATQLDARLGGTNRWLSLNLRPLWPGTIINTVFYALLLLGVYYLLLGMRHRRRIRRGQCPGCGYDLRGGGHAACPECGETVTG